MPPASRLALVLLLTLCLGWGFLSVPQFYGDVRDDEGPVAQARVRGKGSREAVFSDACGRFRLSGRAGRVTAWKEGYFITGTDADRSPLSLTLKRLPAQDHEGYVWLDPAEGERNCAACHVEIFREWSAGGHARSAVNRRFLNLYDGTDWAGRPNVGWNLLAQNPGASGVCITCHAPTLTYNDFDLREARGTAARGVHCDFCHKVVDAGLGTIGLTHGRDGMKFLRPAEGQVFFGPLDDADGGEDSFAPIYRRSRYCASCHEGTVLGVHVYGTYSEWLASPARRQGKQCQTCHMTPTGTMRNFAPGKGGINRDPWSLASHRLRGAEPDVLRRCLKVSTVLTPTPAEVRVVVTVVADAAEVGHRVPTGFADRNLLLVVEPLGRDGKDTSGLRLDARRFPTLPAAAGKELAGKPGRLYAKLLRDFDGRSPAPFWNARPETTDTRLFPGQADRIEFAFPAETQRVRVRLLYRRFWQETADSKGWPENEIVVVDEIHEF